MFGTNTIAAKKEQQIATDSAALDLLTFSLVLKRERHREEGFDRDMEKWSKQTGQFFRSFQGTVALGYAASASGLRLYNIIVGRAVVRDSPENGEISPCIFRILRSKPLRSALRARARMRADRVIPYYAEPAWSALLPHSLPAYSSGPLRFADLIRRSLSALSRWVRIIGARLPLPSPSTDHSAPFSSSPSFNCPRIFFRVENTPKMTIPATKKYTQMGMSRPTTTRYR